MSRRSVLLATPFLTVLATTSSVSAQQVATTRIVSQPTVTTHRVIQSSPTVVSVSPGHAATSSSCPTCRQNPSVRSVSIPGTIISSSPVSSSAVPIASTVVRKTASTVRGGISNVLATLNAQRSRQGIGTLRYDASLQAVAERRAQKMASMGIKGHPPGSFSPGTYEGVGWSSSYSPSGVSACFTSDPRMKVAGAAMATGRDGVYFAVVYR